MEINLNTRTVPCCRELFRQTKLVQEHAEAVVPDVNDDIGKIAWSEAQICLKSKECGLHGVSVGASADISVFYLTETRDRVLCTRFSKDFSVEFDCGGLEAENQMQVSLRVLGVQARALNPRKFGVDFTLRAELGCYSEECMTASVTAESEEARELQFLRERSDCIALSSVCEKSFVVSEQLPVPQDGMERLASAQATLVSGDCQMIGGKALVKGGAELRFGLESGDGKAPVFAEQCVPFSVLIDSGDEDCSLAGLILQPTALYAELSDSINGGRVIELELHAAAQARFEKNVSLDYIVDAYSTRCPLRCEEATLEICTGRNRQELCAECGERVALAADGAAVLAQHAELLSYTARDGSAAGSAAVSVLLQNPDGGFDTLQKLLAFEAPLPSPDWTVDSVKLTSLFVQITGDELEIKLSACFSCALVERRELRYLSAVESDEESAYDLASFPSLSIVNRRGRSLWELAKSYHSGTEAIERLNEKYPMQGDLLLIPRI